MNDNNNILREIIDVEKEIQLSLDRTKGEMRVWLDTRKKELDEELAKEEKDQSATYQRSREELTRNAVSTYAGLVKTEEMRRERLVNLKHETIAGIVENHIHKILPG